jgi:hypothetical protein
MGKRQPKEVIKEYNVTPSGEPFMTSLGTFCKIE